MKRKITQIGKLLAAAALFFGASSWASAQETVTATWALTEGGVQAATFSAENVLEGSMAAVPDFDFVGTENWRDASNTYLDPEVIFTQISPATKHASPDQASITFTLTPVKGMVYTPTNLTVNTGRFGSDSGDSLNIYVKTSAGSVKLNSETIVPLRSQKGMYTTVNLPISGITVEDEPVTFEFWFKCDATRKVGLNNLVISGTYTAAEPAKVAYLCGENAVDCNEAVYKALTNSGLNVTPLNFDEVSLTGDLAADGLADYDLVVIAGPTGSSVALAKTFDKIVGKVPVLSTKSFWYAKTTPAFGGSGVNPGSAENPSMTLVRTELYEGHTIYSGIEGDTILMYTNAGRESGRYLQGIPTSGNVYEHTVLATTNGADCVAEFWADGVGYVIIPFDGEGAEYTVLDGALTAEGAQIFVNAANYLLDGEPYEVPYFGDCAVEISTVALEGEYAGQYQLNITATPDTAKIYYTTDGTVPTTSSKLYTAPDTIVKNCLIQAIAVADKWRDSAIDCLEFVNTSIATLPAPTFTVVQDAANHCATVTIEALAAEYTGYNFYYTTDGSIPTENSTLYTEPFNFYGESMTVKAIAVGDLYNTSAVGEQSVVNENYLAREKVAFTTNFHDPLDEWFYNVDFVFDENDPTKVVAATVKPGAVWPEGMSYTQFTEKDGFRVHVFDKGNTYTGYRQYNNWSFYGETGRRIILQHNKGAWFLNASGKTSVAPNMLFEGPFDIEVEIKNAKQESVFYVYVGDELEGDTWELIGTTTISATEGQGTVKGSYNGSSQKYVRVETTAKEFYMNEFTVKVSGYGEMAVESVSPAGSTTMADAVLIADTTTTFVVTFNNPLAETQADNLIVFFGEPAMPATNCTYAISGNTMTITRQGTEPLAGATYQLVVQNVTDVVGQTYARLSQFYKVESTSSGVTAPEVEKEVVSTVIYSISGAVQSELTQGLNFVRTVYSDGSVEVEKVIVK